MSLLNNRIGREKAFSRQTPRPSLSLSPPTTSQDAPCLLDLTVWRRPKMITADGIFLQVMKMNHLAIALGYQHKTLFEL